ncbi:DUF4352 domain-containing protein [Mycobacterium sp. AMU20-3851]|uniref:DUF4352 domain-containing protein n=1 Tax=Mycobacterium sp. AMU20-3851 TaxID=3122055 RepID=UPI0037553859
MTTPPTTAGWYPDPDGSGGQRYWDGTEWTAQRPDAPESTEETSAWPAELPPWPDEDMEMPSWEEAGKAEPSDEEPEAIEPEEPAEISAPESPDSEPAEPVVVPEPAAPSEPTAAVEQPYAYPGEPAAAAVPPEPVAPLVDQPSAAVPVPEQTPGESGGGRAKAYLIGIGALVVVLVGVLIWVLTSRGSDSDTSEATGADETSEVAGATGPATESADQSQAPAEAPTGGGPQVVDGEVTITGKGFEVTPTVAAVENEMLTKSAAGEFVVVRLTLLNNGELPATFLADQQILTAGGQTYNPETESTFYLGGISAVLYPGQPADVAIAFDVPAGTAPESIEVHGDLASAGGVIPLS